MPPAMRKPAALVHSFESVGDERFPDEPDNGESATSRLGRAIASCLPAPGRQERDWVLWVELWLRATRDPALRPIAGNLYSRYRKWIAQAIAAQARQFPGQEKQIFEAYQRSPQLVAQIRAPLYEEKVVDYIMELIKVSNETVTREALFAEDEPPTPSPKAKKAKKSKAAKAEE